jgi:hypothetical protein
MYEIWLALNIAWEIASTRAVLLAFVAAFLLLAWVLALRAPGARWRLAAPRAVAAGFAAAVLAGLLWPALTGSSLGEIRYWVDAVSLAGLALAAGGAVGAFAWPVLAWFGREGARASHVADIRPQET